MRISQVRSLPFQPFLGYVMGNLTEDFNSWEFRCRCGQCQWSDGNAIDIAFVNKLQKIRDIYKKAMPINCGVRCPEHNSAVGGVAFSYHLPDQGCKAADIGVSSRAGRIIIVREALALGLSVGIYKNFLHLDRRPVQTIFTG